MAYSDYVQIYRVWDEASITETDDRAAQVAKIAAWINEKFGDTVTASTVDDVRVLVMDKTVHAGFWWGQPQTSNTSYPGANYPNNRGTVFYKDGSLYYMTESDFRYYYSSNGDSSANSLSIDSLGLFVCKTTHGYAMEFINLSDRGFDHEYIFFIVTNGKIKGLGDDKKCAIFGNGYYISGGARYTKWGCIVEAHSTAGAYNVNQPDYFRYCNISAQTSILTKYNPYGSDLICENVLAVNGEKPANNTIFDIDGTKYLSLNYNGYGGDCHGLAFKLD